MDFQFSMIYSFNNKCNTIFSIKIIPLFQWKLIKLTETFQKGVVAFQPTVLQYINATHVFQQQHLSFQESIFKSPWDLGRRGWRHSFTETNLRHDHQSTLHFVRRLPDVHHQYSHKTNYDTKITAWKWWFP